MLAMPLMTACGSDDNENSGSSYTTDEIVDLLNGKWQVSGDAMLTEIETGKRLGGNYFGTMEFDKKQNCKWKFENNPTIEELNFEKSKLYASNDFERLLVYMFYNSNYSILKKEGKNYFVVSSGYEFEINYITKSTFKMTLDKDLKIDNKKCHLTATLVSK